MKKFIASFFLYLLLFMGLSSFARQRDSTQVKKNIRYAFENFKAKDFLYLDLDIEKKLKKEYLSALMRINPDEYQDKQGAQNLILYYSSPIGIEEILRGVINKNDEKGEIFITSIWDNLDMQIYFQTRVDDRVDLNRLRVKITSDISYKYATLLPRIKKQWASAWIYLNGDRNCSLSNAKNGIIVHSGKIYNIEIKSQSKVLCRARKIFKQGETKILTCL